MQTERVELYCDKGGSDKVYVIELKPSRIAGVEGRFDTIGYNGARGGTLYSQPKAIGKCFEDAKAAFDRTLKEKLSPKKGYRVVQSDAAPQTLALAAPQGESVFQCELVDHILEEDSECYLDNDDWWMQRKRNGRRLSVEKRVHSVTESVTWLGYNKLGVVIGLSDDIIKMLSVIKMRSLLRRWRIGENGLPSVGAARIADGTRRAVRSSQASLPDARRDPLLLVREKAQVPARR